MRGGTFTISNHGVSGSLLAAPIVINQPQSAILGVGKLEKRAVVVSEGGEDVVVIRPKCYVTLDDRPSRDGWPPGESLPADVRQGAGGVAGALNVWPRIETDLISTQIASPFFSCRVSTAAVVTRGARTHRRCPPERAGVVLVVQQIIHDTFNSVAHAERVRRLSGQDDVARWKLNAHAGTY